MKADNDTNLSPISAEVTAGEPAAQSICVMRAPGDLTPWENNPRTHSAKQLEKLKASIRKFGFTAPVLIDEDGVILGGHGRAQAAKEMGLAQIPVRTIAGLTKAQKRAYVIADNKLAQESAWDKKLLKGELEILTHEDFEIEYTGFSTAEIDIMLDGDPQPETGDPDDELPDKASLAVPLIILT